MPTTTIRLAPIAAWTSFSTSALYAATLSRAAGWILSSESTLRAMQSPGLLRSLLGEVPDAAPVRRRRQLPELLDALQVDARRAVVGLQREAGLEARLGRRPARAPVLREAGFELGAQPRGLRLERPLQREELVHPHRLGLALDAQRIHFARLDALARELARGVADEEARAVELVRAFQARS